MYLGWGLHEHSYISVGTSVNVSKVEWALGTNGGASPSVCSGRSILLKGVERSEVFLKFNEQP